MVSLLRLIGDVHGKVHVYKKLIKDCKHSIQLGDFAFDYQVLRCVNAKQHRILLGNHENYELRNKYPHFLPDYGVHCVDDQLIFFIRGGFSVDWQYRVENIDWFREEELGFQSQREAFDMYCAIEPKIMISHECPASILSCVGKAQWSHLSPSTTSNLLQACFEVYQPQLWVFAHHHRRWQGHVNGTHFICLEELGTLDILDWSFLK